MFCSRSGHVISVDTHRARVIPHPQEHRSRFAAWRALLLSLDVSAEKLTTAMSRSVYATPEVREMPHTSRATPPTTPIHVRIPDMDRAGFLRAACLPEVRPMRPHGNTTRHSVGGKRARQRLASTGRKGAPDRLDVRSLTLHATTPAISSRRVARGPLSRVQGRPHAHRGRRGRRRQAASRGLWLLP